MKDLLLWKQLQRKELDVAQALPLLKQLAALPLEERFPFIAFVTKLLEAEDESLRQAAAEILSGVKGLMGVQQLKSTLDDACAGVRNAAIDSLRVSAATDAAWWTFSVFHRRPDVRLQALKIRQPDGAEALGFFSLPEAAAREIALARLRDLSHPELYLPAILDFVRNGHLPREHARDLLHRCRWQDVFEQYLPAGRPMTKAIKPIFQKLAAGVHSTAAIGADVLDDIFELLWDSSEASTENERHATLLWSLEQWMEMRAEYPEDSFTHYRVATSMIAVSARRRVWPDWAMAQCAGLHPDMLLWAWIPRDVRRAAVKVISQRNVKVVKQPLSRAKEFLRDPLILNGTKLELATLAHMLNLFVDPASALLNAYDLNMLARHASRAPLEAALLIEAGAHDDGFLKRVVKPLEKLAEWSVEEITAFRILAAPTNRMTALDTLQAPHSIGVLKCLLEMLRQPGLRVSEKKQAYIAARIGSLLAGQDVAATLSVLAKHAGGRLSTSVLGVLSRETETNAFISGATALRPGPLVDFLNMIKDCAGFSAGKEMALANALTTQTDVRVVHWVRERLKASDAVVIDLPPPLGVVALSHTEQTQIERCSDADLPMRLAVALKNPTQGLCRALSGRSRSKHPSVQACLALLGCHDPIRDVDTLLVRFGSEDAVFVEELMEKAVSHWQSIIRDAGMLPWHGNAWLHLWEKHCFAFGEAALKAGRSFTGVLKAARKFQYKPLGDEIWHATARLVCIWCARDATLVVPQCSGEFLDELIAELPQRRGSQAAEIINALYRCKETYTQAESRRPQIHSLLPDLDAHVRRHLEVMFDLRGMVGGPPARRVVKAEVPREILKQIATSSDVELLRKFCHADNVKLVEEAVLRLLELGDEGSACLVRLIVDPDPPSCAFTIAEFIADFADGPWLKKLAAFARSPEANPELRLLVCLGMCERGEDAWQRGFDIVNQPSLETWFRQEHWARMLRIGKSASDLALGMSASPHPAAYAPAVEHLLVANKVDKPIAGALKEFLFADSERLFSLRVRAAMRLAEYGIFDGLPILIRWALSEAKDPEDKEPFAAVLEKFSEKDLNHIVDCVLAAFPNPASEPALIKFFRTAKISDEILEALIEKMLLNVHSIAVRTECVRRLKKLPKRGRKLRLLAETFLWGASRARELTGKVFRIEMLGNKDLGYTRFAEQRVFVSVLPILRGDVYGKDVVQGLILHELGHHMYHNGPGDADVWKAAEVRRMHRLLNLVSDEHLERNLRADDEADGDLIKRLNAYAFQHTARDIPLQRLLITLQSKVWETLTRVEMEVSREPKCVRVNSGDILMEIERGDLSFGRFFRALRMGLGNRHNDPLVEQGLALFRGKFRKSSMQQLFDIAQRLEEIFGWQVRLLDCFEPETAMLNSENETIILRDDISDEDVRDEMDRLKRTGPDDKKPRRVVNMRSDDLFETIHNVVPVPFVPSLHAEYTRKVHRFARQMRPYFLNLGRSAVRESRRVQGRWLDRSRLMPLIVRGDPRTLIARRIQQNADLFIGVVIDCSGSMRMNENIEKAKQFGTLLAEAVKGISGIDMRVFGFTDSRIFDCGDARRCAAHSLESEGGNNDAAALNHAAQVARGTRRSARLLVMISDGAPTECTTTALKGLVERLTRERFCCAQVALHSLEEVCFPNYILLEEDNLSESVRRFGAIVVKLVRQALQLSK